MFDKQNNHLHNLSSECETLKKALPALVVELLEATETELGVRCIFTTALRGELRARAIPYSVNPLYQMMEEMGFCRQNINIPLGIGGYQHVRVWGKGKLCKSYKPRQKKEGA